MIKVVGNKGVLGIIAIFVAVLVLGMLLAIEAINTSGVSILYNTLLNPRFAAFSYFLDATLVLIIALLLLRRQKHYSNTVLFVALEGIVTSLTSFFFFLLLFAILFPDSVTNGGVYMYSIALALFLILMKNRFHGLKNLTTVVSSIGVGLILGFNFPFGYAIFILAVVAIYDYIGVFKTKEMVTLANAFSSHDLAFLISVSDLEAVPEWGLSAKEKASYMRYLSTTHGLDNPKFREILQRGRLPVVSQISLGEGDLSLPLMAAISAYSSLSHALSAVVVLGSIAGIFVTMLILKRYKRPIPAIPPLFASIDVFVGVAFVLTSTAGFYGAILITISALTMLVNILTITRRMHAEMKTSR